MDYFGIIPGQSSRLSKVTKWFVAAVAAYMGFRGVQAGLWYYIPFALALIVVAFFRKEQVLNDEGIDFRRVFVVYKTHSIWPWQEVTRILADYETMKPAALLLVYRGDKPRQIMMAAEDAKAVVKLARKKNPDIVLETQDETGRHKAYNYNRGSSQSKKTGQIPVQQAEDFSAVKEAMKKKQERAEYLAGLHRPDPRTSNKIRPEKKLRGFH
ncbi:MAG: hypothetical protein IJ128_08460 [Firmicutes bacterium]|nr:hypothetical protein [Bacillota bacterium]